MASWRKRPWARTFDLISSAYGWTDDTILDLTLERIEQVRDVILDRQAEDRTRRIRETEPGVKAIVGAVLASVGAKDANKAAAALDLTPAPAVAPDGSKRKRKIRYFPAEKANSLFAGA